MTDQSAVNDTFALPAEASTNATVYCARGNRVLLWCGVGLTVFWAAMIIPARQQLSAQITFGTFSLVSAVTFGWIYTNTSQYRLVIDGGTIWIHRWRWSAPIRLSEVSAATYFVRRTRYGNITPGLALVQSHAGIRFRTLWSRYDGGPSVAELGSDQYHARILYIWLTPDRYQVLLKLLGPGLLGNRHIRMDETTRLVLQQTPTGPGELHVAPEHRLSPLARAKVGAARRRVLLSDTGFLLYGTIPTVVALLILPMLIGMLTGETPLSFVAITICLGIMGRLVGSLIPGHRFGDSGPGINQFWRTVLGSLPIVIILVELFDHPQNNPQNQIIGSLVVAGVFVGAYVGFFPRGSTLATSAQRLDATKQLRGEPQPWAAIAGFLMVIAVVFAWRLTHPLAAQTSSTAGRSAQSSTTRPIVKSPHQAASAEREAMAKFIAIHADTEIYGLHVAVVSAHCVPVPGTTENCTAIVTTEDGTATINLLLAPNPWQVKSSQQILARHALLSQLSMRTGTEYTKISCDMPALVILPENGSASFLCGVSGASLVAMVNPSARVVQP